MTISAWVFSPFIPLNAREYATAATVLQYAGTNTTQKPVTVTLSGWLQNFVCTEILNESSGDHFNKAVSTPGRYSVQMSLLPGLHPVTGKSFPAAHPHFGNMSFSRLGNDGYADADYTGPGDRSRADSFRAVAGDTLR